MPTRKPTSTDVEYTILTPAHHVGQLREMLLGAEALHYQAVMNLEKHKASTKGDTQKQKDLLARDEATIETARIEMLRVREEYEAMQKLADADAATTPSS